MNSACLTNGKPSGGGDLNFSHHALLARKIGQGQTAEHCRYEEAPDIARTEVIGNIGFFTQAVEFFRGHRGVSIDVGPAVELLPVFLKDVLLKGVMQESSWIGSGDCELNREGV